MIGNSSFSSSLLRSTEFSFFPRATFRLDATFLRLKFLVRFEVSVEATLFIEWKEERKNSRIAASLTNPTRFRYSFSLPLYSHNEV